MTINPRPHNDLTSRDAAGDKKNKWSLNCEYKTFITSRLAHKFNLNNYIPQYVLNNLDDVILCY